MRIRGVAGGAGLLVLVVTVGLMVLLGMRVLDSVTGSGSGVDGDATPSAAAPRAPVAPMVPPGAVPAAPGRDDATALACDVNRRTLETALNAYAAAYGEAAADQAALVASGMLREPVSGHVVVVEGSTARVEAVEECAP